METDVEVVRMIDKLISCFLVEFITGLPQIFLHTISTFVNVASFQYSVR